MALSESGGAAAPPPGSYAYAPPPKTGWLRAWREAQEVSSSTILHGRLWSRYQLEANQSANSSRTLQVDRWNCAASSRCCSVSLSTASHAVC